MTTKEIEYLVKKSFAAKTPDVLDRIKDSCGIDDSIPMDISVNRRKSYFFQKARETARKAVIAAASFALVIISAFVILSGISNKDIIPEFGSVTEEKEDKEQKRESLKTLTSFNVNEE